MTEIRQIYYCYHCRNIVQIIGEGEGVLICCNSKMALLEAKTSDEGKEKHIPIIERKENGILVKVGDIPHPMEEDHYITWIGIEIDGVSYEKCLTFRDNPEAFFPCIPKETMVVREVCNRHLLWKAEY